MAQQEAGKGLSLVLPFPVAYQTIKGQKMIKIWHPDNKDNWQFSGMSLGEGLKGFRIQITLKGFGSPGTGVVAKLQGLQFHGLCHPLLPLIYNVTLP